MTSCLIELFPVQELRAPVKRWPTAANGRMDIWLRMHPQVMATVTALFESVRN